MTALRKPAEKRSENPPQVKDLEARLRRDAKRPNHVITEPSNGNSAMPDLNDLGSREETVEVTPPIVRKGFDYLQLGFWTALTIAGGAAGMALTWTEAVGPAGVVLVIALGAMALVLVLWAMRGAGRKLGVFPEKGAAEAAEAKLA